MEIAEFLFADQSGIVGMACEVIEIDDVMFNLDLLSFAHPGYRFHIDHASCRDREPSSSMLLDRMCMACISDVGKDQHEEMQ